MHDSSEKEEVKGSLKLTPNSAHWIDINRSAEPAYDSGLCEKNF